MIAVTTGANHPFFHSCMLDCLFLNRRGDTDILTVLNFLQTEGLAPYHRRKGKPFSGELAEFGEDVYVRDPVTRHAKLDDRWIGPVTWIGKAERGDQHMTVSADRRETPGAIACRAARNYSMPYHTISHCFIAYYNIT